MVAGVGEASSARVRATRLPMVEGEVVVVAAPLGEVKRVAEVEAVAQQVDPTKTKTTSTKGQTRGMAAARHSDQSSSSPRTFPRCTHNAKRPGTRSMRLDVAAPR